MPVFFVFFTYLQIILKTKKALHNYFLISFFLKYESSRKYYFHQRPIEDPSETDMPDWRPIGDRQASLETNMPHQRPIRDRHA